MTFAVTFVQVKLMLQRQLAGAGHWGAFIVAVMLAAPSSAVLAPVGNEFPVSTRNPNSQTLPAVAASDDGFVIVWSNGTGVNPSPDGDRTGVFGQRYASSGNRLGTEFQVNTYTTGDQRHPAIAGRAAGDFVVVWDGIGTVGAGSQGQRYDSGGVALGTEFRISPDANLPHVAMRTDGSFVVVWWGGNDGGVPPVGQFGIFAQRYDSAATTIGGIFQVNAHTTGFQQNPDIATSTGGGFVIVWQSDQDGSEDGIFGQRFTSAGMADGTEFQVNTYTTGFQRNPAIAANTAGNFVVAWRSRDQDGSSYGIFGQRFGTGGMIGTEFRVNSYTPFDQSNPDVAMDADGRFVVTWASTSQDGNGRGIFAQEFDAAGARVGTEFPVNATTSGDQLSPAVSAVGPEEFVITWDTGATGVFARRFAPPTPTAAPSPTPTSTPIGGNCPGDCDASKVVMVNELVLCVNISLDAAALSACTACDNDRNGRVTIDELVRAVNAALHMCPA